MKLLFTVLYFITFNVQADNLLQFKSSVWQTTLIELYTSEGCSSCPPADNKLSQFKNDPRLWKEVIPIAFHVDYWDYIGWLDPFASPKNTRRQYRHKAENNIATVYTPGVVVDGEEWRGWQNGQMLEVKPKHKPGVLEAKLNTENIAIKFFGRQQALDYHIAILGFELKTSVAGGENAGKQLQHDFVALTHQIVQSNDNQVSLNLAKVSGYDQHKKAIVVWINKPNSLKPLQAVGGWIN